MMDSVFIEILKRVDRLAAEIAALKIVEGAGTAGGAISGSGTTGRITQWNGASSLGDSTLIKTGVGVLTLTSDTDYTLTADTSGTIQTQEAAESTYLKLDGSNDPMTGGLAIVGGANEVQFAVTAANGQAAHLMTVNDSSNATTFWFNNGGSPFVENKNFTFINSAVPIDAYRDAGTSNMRFSTYTDNTTNGGRISLRGAGGTFASPTDMLNNYICGEMQWFGYVNGAHRQGFVIRASMVNTISSTSYPTNAYFILTLQGATTGTTVITLHNNGYVGVNTGTGAPLGMLGIVARAATDIGLSVKGASSQSANLTNWQNSSNTILALVDAVGGAVFNENGDAAGDVRAESDTKTHMIFLDASANAVGINQASPTAYLHIGAGSTAAGTAPLKLTTQASPLTAVEQGAFELVGNSLQFTQLAKRRGVAMTQSTRTADFQLISSSAESAAIITAEHGAGYLEVGKMEEIRLVGTIQKDVGAPTNTLTIRVKYAGTTIQTITTPNTAIAANTAIEISVYATCRSTGATGTLQLNSVLSINGVTTDPVAANLVTVDTTTAQNTTVTAQFTNSSATNNLVIYQGRVLCVEPNK